jgi:hypothetical protein
MREVPYIEQVLALARSECQHGAYDVATGHRQPVVMSPRPQKYACWSCNTHLLDGGVALAKGDISAKQGAAK